jgi:hypothetical protein
MLTSEWTFQKLKGEDGKIRVVEWLIKWTDQSFPGVELSSSGEVVIAPLTESTASKTKLRDAVIKALGQQYQEIQSYISLQMAHQFESSKFPVLDGGNLVVPPDLHDQVNNERDRRLMSPFPFGDKTYDFDPVSKTRISGAGTLAGFAVAQGAAEGNYLWHGGADPFSWIAADNSLTLMDAPTCFAFARAAAAWEAAHVFAARALKDAATIPSDYANDDYWPPNPPHSSS